MGHHFGTFFISGLGGALQGHAGDNEVLDIVSPKSKPFIRFGFNSIGYSLEYLGMSRVKGNYQKMYHKGWEQKARIYSFKSVMYILIP
jgi:hypothetical protein